MYNSDLPRVVVNGLGDPVRQERRQIDKAIILGIFFANVKPVARAYKMKERLVRPTAMAMLILSHHHKYIPGPISSVVIFSSAPRNDFQVYK
jgi:hypothetical protein